MRQKYYLLVILILLLSSTLSSVGNPNEENKIITVGSTPQISDSISLQKVIRENTRKVDLNGDKVADYLENTNGLLDIIVLFEDYSFIPSKLKDMNILETFTSVPAIHLKVESSMLSVIKLLPGLSVIEGNLMARAQLAYSTNQMDVREGVWKNGFTGSSSYSIAVLDTGIDATHTAFTDRLVASYNAFDNNATAPIDGDGHGTHVAGIAAGQYDMDNIVVQTTRGKLPQDGYISIDITVPNIGSTVDVVVGIDWAAEGLDSPGTEAGVLLYKVTGTTITQSFSFSSVGGKFETTFSVPPGDYVAAFANYNGAFDQTFEGWVKMPVDSSLPSEVASDGFPAYAGVAYSTNIVAVKVLDDTGSGSLSTILAGIDWVISNKLNYNIVVVNLSLGIANEIVSSLDTAMANLVNAGIIPVVAAGNDGPGSGGIYSPGSAAAAITVGAVNRVNEVAYYSSVGSASVNSAIKKPDILAPGGSYVAKYYDSAETGYAEGIGLILSADSNYVGFNSQESDLVGYQGTSMASPHIAGLAALLVEYYSNGSSWTWSSSDVLRIKQAILAGTFEVANIANAGGEHFGGETDPSPIINRNQKDYYEGWGAISAKAAFDALNKETKFGNRIVRMELQNPFGIKVSTSTLFAEAGKTYTYSVDVPDGADVDLLIFEADASNYGELNLLYSSMNASKLDASNDESITISVVSDTELMLVTRLVDSDNTFDDISISVFDPLFIPNISIIKPSNNTAINSNNVSVVFESVTGSADIYIDDVSVGTQASGYILTNLSEGHHNLTVIEINSNTNFSSRSYVDFIVDVTNPLMEFNTSSISISMPYNIKVNVSDNLVLDRVELWVDDVLHSTVLVDQNSTDVLIPLNPYSFGFGPHQIKIKLIDLAGNNVSNSTSYIFEHDTFLLPNSDSLVFELGNSPSITWSAGINGSTALSYSIILDNKELINNTWNGGDIKYSFESLGIGIYQIEIRAQSSSILLAVFNNITIRDTTIPVFEGPKSGFYDGSTSQTFVFSLTEIAPDKLMIKVDDLVNTEINNWNGIDGLSLTLTGYYNNITVINLFAFDTSGNKGEYEMRIIWKDQTKPVFTEIPEDMSFSIGEAVNTLSWYYNDSFVSSVKLKVNDEIIDEQLEGFTGVYLVDLKYLNNLEVGTYTLILSVRDLGNSIISDEVVITVTSSTKSTTEVGIFSFLPILYQTIILGILIIPIIRKIRNKKNN